MRGQRDEGRDEDRGEEEEEGCGTDRRTGCRGGAVDLGLLQTAGLPFWALDRQLRESVHDHQLTPAAPHGGVPEW